MSQPKIVYLDSSDYSVGSDPSRSGDPAIEHYVRSLREAKSDQRAIFPFSAVHISEAAHLEVRFRPFAAARASLMSELSGGRNFLFPADLLFYEMLSLHRGGSGVESPLVNDGRWWPRGLNFATDMHSILHKDFDKAMTKALKDAAIGFSRKERRQLQSRIIKQGRLTPEGRKMMADEASAVSRRLADELGLPSSPSRDELITGILTDREPPASLARRFEQEFFNIERFIGWYVDSFDRQRKVVGWLRTFNSTITEVVRDLQRKLLPLLARNPGVSGLTSFKRNVREGVATGLHRNRHKPEKLDISFNEWMKCVRDSPDWALPSLDTLAFAVDKWVAASCLNAASPRKIKDSDGADLFHCLYIPVVDVFKCDKFMANLLGDIGQRFDTTIVSSPSEVISAIA